MSTLYEIFNTEAEANTKNTKIDTLLGYPNGAQIYRKNIQHQNTSDQRVAAIVGAELIEACAGMMVEDRLKYYDSDNLVDMEFLMNQNWFTDPSHN